MKNFIACGGTMFKKTVIIFALILLISISAQSQVQMKEPLELEVKTLTASAIDLEEGEKLLVIPALGFQFESPAAVTMDFIYFLRPVLEIQSSKVPMMAFVAPVNLPEGTEIRRIGMCFSDSTMYSVVRLKLIHNDPMHPDRNRGALASVKSYKTKDARTFAIAKSGPAEDVIVDIKEGYYFLSLNLQKNNQYCRFAYAYVIYK